MSVTGKRWVDVAADAGCAEALARALGVPLSVATVLVGRGVDVTEAAQRFLAPRLSDLSDPFTLPHMPAAVERLWSALTARARITIFGDYDVDGVTGTALLSIVLRGLGGEVATFLPQRDVDGYGLSLESLAKCIARTQPALIVTVDCGTNSAAAVEQARAQGIAMVITDHHDVAGPLTDAAPVVNPQLGAAPAVRHLAGVGVVFKLCHALLKRARASGHPAGTAIDLRERLDLVALGTVADVVPLVGENRILTRHGLDAINRTQLPGLRALKDVARVPADCTTYHLGFVLGPRLNAAGRLGNAGRALELLLTADPDEARALAGELDRENVRRRAIEGEIRAAAEEEIDRTFDPAHVFGLVVADDAWHVGTVGIVAARLCQRYGRPAVVIGGFDAAGKGRGSCRSVEGLDLVGALQECAAHLASFGGHKQAAGLVLERANVPAFREAFNAACARRLAGCDLRPVLRVDAWLSGAGEADEALLDHLERLQPTGSGNPSAVLALRGLIVADDRPVGEGHRKLRFASGPRTLDAIAFGMGACTLPDGPLDVAFHLQRNTYNGVSRLQLNVQDLRGADVPH